MCESFVADYGLPRERTHVIPPGVDTAAWRPGAARADDVFRVLFVGGDFDRKGGPALLDAFAALPGAKELVVVTRSSIGRCDDVRVINDLGPNDPRLIDLYRSSDVFALPSLAETFGIAAVEAAAAGLPVIASAVGGIPDIVHDGVTGYTVPPGDVRALTDRLMALRDPERRAAMGAAARTHAEHHLDARVNAARLAALVRAAAG